MDARAMRPNQFIGTVYKIRRSNLIIELKSNNKILRCQIGILKNRD